MNRFHDRRAEDIYYKGESRGVPKGVSRVAHTKIHLLTAAAELQDVGVIGQIQMWQKWPGECGLNISGKWFIVFEWQPSIGAVGIRIQRR